MSLSAPQLAAQKNISWVLAEKLAQKILTGEYQPESILPGEMELGEQFGVRPVPYTYLTLPPMRYDVIFM
ncbi:GntR family transcriptional regulator, partial [Klebsiella pneumoniae]|uniref:GntR family transcriptional regulator n=1 Tax=Klebsiella pneumoniae TaxID=573 RepID=UPI0024AF6815